MESSPHFNHSNFLFREWKFSCEIPAGRQGIQPMQNENEVYFYSGRVANVRGQYRTYATDFWKLDLDLMLWSAVELRGIPPPPCMNYSVALWKGAAYLFGGCGDAGVFDSLYKFEFATGLWTQLGQGGGSKNHGTTETTSTDAGTTKRSRSPLCWPPSRHAHTAVTYGDAMYVFGGSSRNAQKIRVDYNDVWRFDFLDQAWTQVWAIPKVSASQLTNTNNANDTTTSSTTATSNTTKKNADPLPGPQPRSYHSAVIAGEFMFVFGGFWMDAKKEYYFNDSWIFDFSSHSWRRLEEREAAKEDQRDDDQVKMEKERMQKLKAKMEPHQQNMASLNKQQKRQLQQQQIKLDKIQKDLAVAQEFSRKCVPRARNRHICFPIVSNDANLLPTFLVHGGNFFDRDSFCSDAYSCQLDIKPEIAEINWSRLKTTSSPQLSNHYCLYYDKFYYMGFGEVHTNKLDTHFRLQIL